MKHVAIIGAGASGLFAAIVAKTFNPKLQISLYEKNSQVGKKILASGNGRCNISNTHLTSSCYFGFDTSMLEEVFKLFGHKEFEAFCQKELGLYLKTQSDGKCYPYSNEAKTVQILLEKKLKELEVQLFTQKEITTIKKTENGYCVDDTIFKNVVIATGSSAAPQIGASNTTELLAKSLNLDVYSFYPVLVGLELYSQEVHKLAGQKIEAKVSILIDGVCEKEIVGDVLFTRYGVSGFAILDCSTIASYALSIGQNVQVSLNLLPNFPKKQLFSVLNNAKDSHYETLLGLLPRKIASFVANKSIKKSINNIMHLTFEVAQTHGFEHAEACGGGVLCHQINAKTMETKTHKGVFVLAEALDIVGNRGGYNFAFAWASAYICGKTLAKKHLK